MDKEPSIVLSGKRDNKDRERFLYLYELKADDEGIVFCYKFSDWTCKGYGYYILYDNKAYFNRDEPVLDTQCQVPDWPRDNAWSSSEIVEAIQYYLVDRILLE